MKKSTFLLLALLASLNFAITAGAADNRTGASKQSTGLHDLAIFFSNDVRGETEPCG